MSDVRLATEQANPDTNILRGCCATLLQVSLCAVAAGSSRSPKWPRGRATKARSLSLWRMAMTNSSSRSTPERQGLACDTGMPKPPQAKGRSQSGSGPFGQTRCWIAPPSAVCRMPADVTASGAIARNMLQTDPGSTEDSLSRSGTPTTYCANRRGGACATAVKRTSPPTGVDVCPRAAPVSSALLTAELTGVGPCSLVYLAHCRKLQKYPSSPWNLHICARVPREDRVESHFWPRERP